MEYGEIFLKDNPRLAISVYDKAIALNNKIDVLFYKKGNINYKGYAY